MGFDLQNPESSSSKEFPCAPTLSHELKMLRGLVFQFCTNMLVILETDNTRRSTEPRSTKPKNCRPEWWATRHQKVQKFLHQQTRASIFLHALTRAESFSCADTRHDVMDDISTHYGLIRLPRPTQFDPFILTRSEPPAKKKKKKKLWPSRTLTLTKKSKFSKMACSTQFFKYIPILRSVYSFETRKLCKLSNS